MKDNDAPNETPLQRFENLAKRVFRMTKDEVEDVERKVEELATDLVKPAEEPEPD